jgi:hypothetical protein
LHVPRLFIIGSHHTIRVGGFAKINLLETVSLPLRFVRPQLVSLIIHPQFRLHLLHSCLCSRLCMQGLAFLVRSIRVARIDKQRSCGVVTARVRRSVRSLHHQRQDLHQSTYLYLSEDWDSTSYQVVSDFRLSMRYYRVPLVYFTVFHTENHQKA